MLSMVNLISAACYEVNRKFRAVDENFKDYRPDYFILVGLFDEKANI